jgi:hypothetical protein
MNLGKKIISAGKSLGKKIQGAGSLGKKVSEGTLKYITPVRRALELAQTSGLTTAISAVPLVGDAAALGILGAAKAARAVETAAKAGKRIGGRVEQYGGAAATGNLQRLQQLQAEDTAKQGAAMERKDVAQRFEELPEFDESLFH